MSRRGHRIGEAYYRNAMANQVNFDPSIGSLQRSNRENAFPGPRLSSPEIGRSIVVARSDIEYEQSSGSRSSVHANGNFGPHVSASSVTRRRQEARLRAPVERLRAHGTQQFEELVGEQDQNRVMGKGLTLEEIMASIGYESFESVGKETQENKEACSICQADYVNGEEVGRLDCAHKFHLDCIKEWLVLKNICPICRRMALMPIDEEENEDLYQKNKRRRR